VRALGAVRWTFRIEIIDYEYMVTDIGQSTGKLAKPGNLRRVVPKVPIVRARPFFPHSGVQMSPAPHEI
jgi:hypothetical protein